MSAPRKIVLLAIVLLILGGVVYFTASTTQSRGLHPGISGSNAAIKIDSDLYDFRTVRIGEIVSHLFIIHNTGSDSLVIKDVKASCGCTATVLDRHVVAPGDSAKLSVNFNTARKAEGHVAKSISITSNSKSNSLKQVSIIADLVFPDTEHTKRMHLFGIFSGDCAHCHVDRGRGRMGNELLAADCAICHGQTPEHGAVAPDLSSRRIKSMSESALRAIIASGSLGRNMPAFSKEEGGPLSDGEIASIVSSIKKFN